MMPGSEKKIKIFRLFGSGSALFLPRYGSGFTQMKLDPARLYRVRIRESVDFSDPGSQVFLTLVRIRIRSNAAGSGSNHKMCSFPLEL